MTRLPKSTTVLTLPRTRLRPPGPRQLVPPPALKPTPLPPRPPLAPGPKRPASAYLTADWTERLRPTKYQRGKLPELRAFNQEYLGIDSTSANPIGGEYWKPTLATSTDVYKAIHTLYSTAAPPAPPAWHADVPTRSQLHLGPMGRPSRRHSATQQACFDTCLFNILTSGYLDYESFMKLSTTCPLITHLGRMIVQSRDHDFTWLAAEDPQWRAQTTIPMSHARAMLSATFFYRMHTPDVMRFLGGTYTGEYR